MSRSNYTHDRNDRTLRSSPVSREDGVRSFAVQVYSEPSGTLGCKDDSTLQSLKIPQPVCPAYTSSISASDSILSQRRGLIQVQSFRCEHPSVCSHSGTPLRFKALAGCFSSANGGWVG